MIGRAAQRLAGMLLAGLLLAGLLAPAASAPAAPAAPALPEASGLLVDETGWLDDASRDRLTQRLEALQASGRAQVALLVASGTRGLALADFSLTVAQSWQLGRAGRDDGVLVLILPATRAVRIEVGYGLEGAIPDLRAREWIDEFKADWGQTRPELRLNRLLDRIESALPAAPAASAGAAPAPARPDEPGVLDRHPEWKLPFLIVVFSPFTLFPLFLSPWGALASAPLFAAAAGAVAWLMWGLSPATVALVFAALALPPLWVLNGEAGRAIGPGLRAARAVANLAGVAFFFSIVSLFVGVGLEAMAGVVWPAFLFSGLLSIGLAVFLFPGEPARLLMLVLRSAMHFAFLLLVIWLVLSDHLQAPTGPALAIAGSLTALMALAIHLEQWPAGSTARRAAHWLTAVALAVAIPFGLILLWKASGGADPDLRAAQAAAGGGSIGAILWWAVRIGFFAALRLGLGGRFGGGGASSQD